MLDFSKIKFNDLSQNAINFQPKQQGLILKVIDYLKSTTAKALKQSVEDAGEENFVIPIEDPSKAYEITAPRILPYTVIGTDGSQILPDRHENLLCFVLNMGSAVIEYGEHAEAKLDNQPYIYYRAEDIYVSVNIVEGGSRRFLAPRWYIDGLRDAKELETLRHKLSTVKERLMNENRLHPILGFVDGNLIRWQVQKIFKKGDIVNLQLHNLLLYSKSSEIPIFGYISKPRGSDVIQLLAWDYERENIESISTEGSLDLLNDVDIFGHILEQANTRTAMFRTQKPATEGGKQRIVFCYFNTGDEIIRLEFPEWIVDENMVDSYFPYVLDQIYKGQGYPICLLESHHQAEVSSKDRGIFYTHLQERLAKAGMKVVNSAKLLSKKHRFV